MQPSIGSCCPAAAADSRGYEVTSTVLHLYSRLGLQILYGMPITRCWTGSRLDVSMPITPRVGAHPEEMREDFASTFGAAALCKVSRVFFIRYQSNFQS